MRARRDEGAAVVWALALVSVIMFMGLLAGAVAEQAIVRQRTAMAADMSALAAAQSPADGCAAAARTAAANGSTLVSCAFDGSDVVVTVSRPPPPLVNRLYELLGRSPTESMATARAGPPISMPTRPETS